MRHYAVHAGISACLLFASAQALAIEPFQEYRKRVESAQNISALTDGLFGDTVNLYNGQTTFNHVDIDLPGNNALPVQLARRFSVQILPQNGSAWDTSLGGAGGWDIDVPYISGTFAPVSGWSAQRCSSNWVPNVSGDFERTEIWQGNSIHLPGGGDRTMLGVEPGTAVPSDSDRITTSERDVFDCIPMLSGLAGEGFRMKTTSGVRYYFDVAVSRYAGQLTRTLNQAMTVSTGRTKVYLLASKVEDRFGNTVNFEYNGNGNPTRIWSNDGREIVLTYVNGLLNTASAAGKTWSYQYATVEGQARLSAVVQPDTSRWQFAYSNSLRPVDQSWDADSDPYCSIQPPELPANFTFTATHPSNAVGTFTFSNSRHYRSGVHISECLQRHPPPGGEFSSDYWILNTPYFFDVMSLGQKTISGPALTQSMTWTYDYGFSDQSLWVTGGPAVYPCTTCATEKTVTVSNPDATRTRYRYGFEYALNEGRVLGVETLDASGTVKRSETTDYMSEAEVAGQNFFTRYGIIYNGDDPSTARVRPVTKRVIQQDGATFTNEVAKGCPTAGVYCFDWMARPTSETKSSSLGYSRTDTTEYYDDQTNWVLGQVKKSTVAGIETGRTDYDAVTALPITAYEFGKLKQTLTYNADGTVATMSDGRDSPSFDTTVTLSSWKRGTPQLIKFPATAESPAGATLSASINDDGSIAWVTDENGYTTAYGYDPMGRLSLIDYPDGDSVNWLDTTLAFTPVLSAEYGLPTGHWKQTISTGNARKITYFDALLRPVVEEAYDATDATTIASTRAITVKRYDVSGQLAFQSYPRASVGAFTDATLTGSRTFYDALDRVERVEQDAESALGVLVTTTNYLSGFQARVTNPRQQVSTTSYMAYDQPTTDWPVLIQQPEGAYVDIGRDALGKPLSLRRRNSDSTVALTRRYVYDGNQQLCKTIGPETGATVMGYDAADNLEWSASGLALTDPANCNATEAYNSGRRATRSYDSRKRLTALSFPDGKGNQAWSYWPDGLMKTIVTSNDGASATNSYEYNKRRLMTSESLSQTDGDTWGLNYNYDFNGNLANHVYPSGLMVAYAPDALGRPTQAGSYATGVSYYPNGAMAQFTYGNGIVHTLSQNERGLPERSKDAYGSTSVLDDSYDYDSNGNVAAISDALSGNRGNRSMTYDGLDRLKTTTSPMFSPASYTYDVLDNLMTVKVAGRDHTYYYDSSNRLTNVMNTVGGASVIGLSYDVQGNIDNKNGQMFAFDYGNRLREAVGKETYRYDGHGRRVQATHPTLGAIRSMYGQDGVLRRQSNQREAKAVDYITLNGSLVARVSNPIAPGVPVMTVPTYSTQSSYTVQWSAVTGSTLYEAQESANGGAWLSLYTGTSLSVAVSGKVTGSYAYHARACNIAGCGPWSASASLSVDLAPAAPPALTVPATGPSGNYTVSWGTASGATSYRLEESANSGAWTEVYNGGAQSNGFANKPAGSYAYRIRACNPVGCSGYSTTATTQVIYPPGVPTLTVPASNYTGGYTVSWTAVSGATTYQLDENINSGSWTQIHNAATTNTALTGRTAAAYGYRVRACNSAGCSASSATMSVVVTMPPTAAPTLTVPGTNYSGGYTVSWTTVGVATSYQLVERLNGGSFTTVYDGASSAANVSGRSPGTWGYMARGCNVGGCGPWSAEKTVPVIGAPAAPTLGGGGTYGAGATYTMDWTASTNATSYELQESFNSGAWTNVASSGTSASFTKSTGGSYAYRVRACNPAGCSSYSATQTATVVQAPPVPTNLRITVRSAWQCTVAWNSSSGATKYELQEQGLTAFEGNALSYTSDAQCFTPYNVRACNTSACSAWSANVY
ncbi:YD repeat-containing protein [Lysobacter niabensis]|uniref:YD repeat-containing protein n=1 Tax=Agrilutibacter niabensis TaxID=380628 RepID=A0ABU1VNX5_9GAMM|nr:RHS repeat protein [Lysobacter niabensis]MDR7099169.1 YD repeat-containing protein [Lysobacter niabensis]